MDEDVKSTRYKVLSVESRIINFGQQNKLSYSQCYREIMKALGKVTSCTKAKSKDWCNLSKDIIQPIVNKKIWRFTLYSSKQNSQMKMLSP